MAPMVRHRFARTATLATIRMPVRLTDTGDLITSWAVCSLELARGTDGDGGAAGAGAASVIATDSVAVFVMVAAFAMAEGSMAGQDLQIGAASRIEEASLAALPAGIAAASHGAAEAFMAVAVVVSTVAAASMGVADRMVAADTVAAIANRN